MINNRVEILYAGGEISALPTTQGYRVGGHALNLIGLLEGRSEAHGMRLLVGNKEIAYTGLSENMVAQDWANIDAKIVEALNRNPRSLVITHGTDSMEQTANHVRQKFIEQLQANDANIILTGATEDIEHPDTDAWINLEFALESAVSDIEPDVYIAFRDRLVRADEAVKIPYVEGGELGYISVNDPLYAQLCKEQRLLATQHIRRLQERYDKQVGPSQVLVYDVNIVRQSHQELLDQIKSSAPRIILLNLYHSGTANTDKPEQSVADLVNKLRLEHGIIFFGVSENGETVNLRAYETSVKMREAGVVPLYNMQREVALTKLQLIDPNHDPTGIIDEMLADRCGEIDVALIIDEDIKQLKLLYGNIN